MSAPDFAILGEQRVGSRDELTDLLRDTPAPAVRVCGKGSSFDRLPAPRRPPLLVRLAAMQRIDRLDPADLTCSVEPGLERQVLDGELERHGLVLPTPGDGTVGGLLARGEHRPLAPGASCARHVVLGLEGVLSDGTQFKVGARVVKSVAGFDVHRAFVGSRGRLLIATLLHLRLRPAPRASLTFAQGPRPLDAALALFRDLRLLAAPPTSLVLHRHDDGTWGVVGRVEGAPAQVRSVRRRFGLDPTDAPATFGPVPAHGRELVDGVVQPSALHRLLAGLPSDAPVHVSGTGQFLTALRPAESDALLARLPSLPGGAGEIRCGSAARRGLASAGDPATSQLEDAVRLALDPRGLLQ
ncbi:MAG: FAD-binding oxidoreductase [Planctomycetota bacterium]